MIAITFQVLGVMTKLGSGNDGGLTVTDLAAWEGNGKGLRTF